MVVMKRGCGVYAMMALTEVEKDEWSMVVLMQKRVHFGTSGLGDLNLIGFDSDDEEMMISEVKRKTAFNSENILSPHYGFALLHEELSNTPKLIKPQVTGFRETDQLENIQRVNIVILKKLRYLHKGDPFIPSAVFTRISSTTWQYFHDSTDGSYYQGWTNRRPGNLKNSPSSRDNVAIQKKISRTMLSLTVDALEVDSGVKDKLSDFKELQGWYVVLKWTLKVRSQIKMSLSIPKFKFVDEDLAKDIKGSQLKMLADSLLPIQFWAEAVNTACYVLNRVLIQLGKFVEVRRRLLLGYSIRSKVQSIQRVTRKVQECFIVNFLENQENQKGKGPDWMFDLDLLTPSMNYIPVRKENYADSGDKVSTLDDVEDLDDQQFIRFHMNEEKEENSIARRKQSSTSTFIISTANTPPQSTGNTPTGNYDEIFKDGIFSTNSYDAEEGGSS
ncbi:hypothetical protein Tco_0019569 [Tanacetum coccineum]